VSLSKLVVYFISNLYSLWGQALHVNTDLPRLRWYIWVPLICSLSGLDAIGRHFLGVHSREKPLRYLFRSRRRAFAVVILVRVEWWRDYPRESLGRWHHERARNAAVHVAVLAPGRSCLDFVLLTCGSFRKALCLFGPNAGLGGGCVCGVPHRPAVLRAWTIWKTCRDSHTYVMPGRPNGALSPVQLGRSILYSRNLPFSLLGSTGRRSLDGWLERPEFPAEVPAWSRFHTNDRLLRQGAPRKWRASSRRGGAGRVLIFSLTLRSFWAVDDHWSGRYGLSRRLFLTNELHAQLFDLLLVSDFCKQKLSIEVCLEIAFESISQGNLPTLELHLENKHLFRDSKKVTWENLLHDAAQSLNNHRSLESAVRFQFKHSTRANWWFSRRTRVDRKGIGHVLFFETLPFFLHCDLPLPSKRWFYCLAKRIRWELLEKLKMTNLGMANLAFGMQIEQGEGPCKICAGGLRWLHSTTGPPEAETNVLIER